MSNVSKISHSWLWWPNKHQPPYARIRCMSYSIQFFITHTRKRHSPSIRSVPQSHPMYHGLYKDDKPTAKISKCPVTSQLNGPSCLPPERARWTEERQGARNGKREALKREEVSICPSPGSHWSAGSEGWEHRKADGIPSRPTEGKQSLSHPLISHIWLGGREKEHDPLVAPLIIQHKNSSIQNRISTPESWGYLFGNHGNFVRKLC